MLVIENDGTVGELKNWVWCESCLEWKDAANEASFLNIEEDSYGKDVMTFECDKCENVNKNIIISSATRPRGSN
tara:strand:- start:364 stop:585 length:222 start_codon:yes stop_codon:yes gene_type:complete